MGGGVDVVVPLGLAPLDDIATATNASAGASSYSTASLLLSRSSNASNNASLSSFSANSFADSFPVLYALKELVTVPDAVRHLLPSLPDNHQAGGLHPNLWAGRRTVALLSAVRLVGADAQGVLDLAAASLLLAHHGNHGNHGNHGSHQGGTRTPEDVDTAVSAAAGLLGVDAPALESALRQPREAETQWLLHFVQCHRAQAA